MLEYQSEFVRRGFGSLPVVTLDACHDTGDIDQTTCFQQIAVQLFRHIRSMAANPQPAMLLARNGGDVANQRIENGLSFWTVAAGVTVGIIGEYSKSFSAC
jgi:hypothetical protein